MVPQRYTARMTLRLIPVFCLLAACDEVNTGFGAGNKDTAGDSGNGGIDTSVDDTEDSDADQDDDGFSPEQGDCDDANPRVSPARGEDDSDDVDNDCDGKVDENFAGLEVAWVESTGAGHLLTFDTIGRIEADLSVAPCAPFFLDHVVSEGAQVADQWIVNDSLAYLAHVDGKGNCTQFADFSDTEVYEFPPYGVTVTPDGTIYVVFGNQLATVTRDGTFTQLAEWNAEEEFYGLGLASDPLTGTVGVFDIYGGFATYHPDEGFVFQLMPDFEAPAIYTLSGAHGDDGNWYAPAYDFNVGSYGVVKFDIATTSWQMQDQWSDEDWQPFMLAVDASDDARPEFYVTASAGEFQTVWRILHGSNAADHLYISEAGDRGSFYGIVLSDGARYTVP